MAKNEQVNMLRPAVGIRDIAHMYEHQNHFRTMTHEGQDVVVATTKRRPRQAEEILATDGSIYWIIKNRIQIRQKIVDLPLITEKDGQTYCRILMEPPIIRVQARQKRAFQGWRYFKGSDVPKDIGVYTGSDDGIPPEMEEELRALGIV